MQEAFFGAAHRTGRRWELAKGGGFYVYFRIRERRRLCSMLCDSIRVCVFGCSIIVFYVPGYPPCTDLAAMPCHA